MEIPDVSLKRDDLAWAVVVHLGCLAQDLVAARCDVDLCPVRNERLCDHQTNSGSAARDESSDVRDIEELGALELLVASFAVTHVSHELV